MECPSVAQSPKGAKVHQASGQRSTCMQLKAKQSNILGSRQHPAEKVALWCEFLFFIFF